MQEASDGDIRHINIESEMRSSYMDYAMSVIVGRALPDARDGLKPVHRRVLFAMRELGNTHNRPYKKSARVVGDVIGKYHPHGDQAVYDTIVRLAQDFSMRYVLVDGQGNFGSLDGDPPAAMRYTEVRMNRLAEDMLEDLDKQTVDFGPNYDESLEQPLVLPAKAPALLMNGSTGIAVGMATNIPPHNLGELVDAVVLLIDRPEATIDDLMLHLKGPDFPTGGMICGTRQIEAMYKLGRGQMRVRARAEVVGHDNGRESIIVTEIPYAVNKARMIEHIAQMVNDRQMEGISDLRDESSGEGVRIVIDLKRGAMAQVVLNNLYKHSQLQTTFGANMLAIRDGRPEVMNLKEMLQCFIDHRFDVLTRRSEFELAKAEARRHILEGFRKALDCLDEVVRVIRGAANRAAARADLTARFDFSVVQADAILEMRLYQLTGLEREKVEEEYRQVVERIAYLRGLLEHPERIFALIREEQLALKERYGDPRRTELVPLEGEVNIEDLIADEPCVVTMSHAGYIKRVPLDTYREQRRGGRGVAGMMTREEDFVERLFVCSTHDTLLFFTTSGRMYAERAFALPEAARASRGKAIVNLLELREDEKIAALLRIREFSEERFLVMASARGIVKKTPLAAYRNLRRGGIIAMNMMPEDRLLGVLVTGGDDDLVLTTVGGMSIRFHESGLREQGRVTRGVRGIRLAREDRVCSLELVDPSATFLVCTEKGYGKRSGFDQYRTQGRGGKGLMTIRPSERNGPVVAAHAAHDSDQLLLVTAQGMMVRTRVGDVRMVGRHSMGVRLVNLQPDDRLVCASVVRPDELDILAEGNGN